MINHPNTGFVFSIQPNIIQRSFLAPFNSQYNISKKKIVEINVKHKKLHDMLFGAHP